LKVLVTCFYFCLGAFFLCTLLLLFLLVHVVTPAEEEEEEEAPGRLVKILGRYVHPLVDPPAGGGGGGWSLPPAAFQLHF
jgi:hypothetical protein